MAAGEIMYDGDRSSSCWSQLIGDPLRTGDYARVTGDRTIQVRGSAFQHGGEWGSNSFRPEEARRLARYILQLADDADKSPEVKELAEDIHVIWQAYDGTAEEFARALIAKGYRK